MIVVKFKCSNYEWMKYIYETEYKEEYQLIGYRLNSLAGYAELSLSRRK